MRGGVWLAWAVGFLLVALVGSVALAADAGTTDATPPSPQPASDGGVKDSTRDEPASAAARTPPKAPKPSAEVNYAAVSAGAVVLGASPGMVGTKSLLDDDKDKYARAQCDQEKYVIINLSEDIKVETIVIANYEKFSSSVKEFEVLYSTVLPQNGDEWHTLGSFTATSKQGAQRFTVESPKYARYLKFQWISHWGDEFYCTMSQIKVHGKTLQESFQRDYEEQRQNTMNHLQALKPDETSEEEVRDAATSIVTAVTGETQPSLDATSFDTAGAEEGGRGEKLDVHGLGANGGSSTVGAEQRDGGEQQGSSTVDVTAGEAGGEDGESPPVCGVGAEGSTSGDGPAACGSTACPVVPISDGEAAAQRIDTASPVGEPPPRLCSERMGGEGSAGILGAEGESSADVVPFQAHDVPSQAQEGVEGLERVDSGVGSMGRGDVVQQPPEAQGRLESSTDAVAPRRVQGGTERKACAAPNATEQPPTKQRCGNVKVEPPTAPQVGVEGGRDGRPPCVETGSDGGQSADSSRGATRGGASDVHTAPSVLSPLAEVVGALPADLPISKPTATTTVEPCRAEEPVGAAKGNVGETGAAEQEVEERSTCPIKGKPKAASSSTSDGNTVDSACQTPQEVEGRDAVIVDGDVLRAAEANASSAARVPPDAAKAPPDTPVASGKDSPHIPPSTPKQPPADKSVATEPSPAPPSPKAATQVASDSEPPKPPAQVNPLSLSSSSSSGMSLDSPAVVTRSGGAVEGAASNTTPLASAAAAAAQPSVVKVRRCLEQLAFPEFKKQKLGKLKEDGSKRGAAMGGAGSSPYDSIFKTLMVEITSQEINQSIFDMYVSQLQQCMAQALDDLRADRDRDRVAHEEAMRLLSNRVLNLSEANDQLSLRLVQLENSLLVSAAAWLVCMLAVILLLLGWCVRAAVRKHH